MTHDELLNDVVYGEQTRFALANALRAVVELHKPELMISSSYCVECTIDLKIISYPCPTIQAIEKELA